MWRKFFFSKSLNEILKKFTNPQIEQNVIFLFKANIFYFDFI